MPRWPARSRGCTARHMAQQFEAAGADIQGMFSNDIVGRRNAHDGTRDPRTVRLFVEGVPTSRPPPRPRPARGRWRERRPVPAARPVRRRRRRQRADRHEHPGGLAPRPVPARQRPHLVPRLGYPAARFTEPREDFAHQHQDVRVENGMQFGDLVEFCDFAYIARVARVNAAALWSLANAPGTPKSVRILTSELTNDTELSGTPTRSPTWPGTKWSGGPPSRTTGPTSLTPAGPPRSESTCPRTTSSSGSVPSTATVTGVRSPSPRRRADHRGTRGSKKGRAARRSPAPSSPSGQLTARPPRWRRPRGCPQCRRRRRRSPAP